MRNETIAVHGGYDVDPTTRAVAVPIYQTVAYAFDSASTERRSSISRSKDTAIAASAIRLMQYSSVASLPWKEDWKRLA